MPHHPLLSHRNFIEDDEIAVELEIYWNLQDQGMPTKCRDTQVQGEIRDGFPPLLQLRSAILENASSDSNRGADSGWNDLGVLEFKPWTNENEANEKRTDSLLGDRGFSSSVNTSETALTVLRGGNSSPMSRASLGSMLMLCIVSSYFYGGVGSLLESVALEN